MSKQAVNLWLDGKRMALEHINAISASVVWGGSYFILGFAETAGLEPFTVIEKLSVGGVIALCSYIGFRYLLKHNAKLENKIAALEKKIEENHADRLKSNKEDLAELKALITGKR